MVPCLEDVVDVEAVVLLMGRLPDYGIHAGLFLEVSMVSRDALMVKLEVIGAIDAVHYSINYGLEVERSTVLDDGVILVADPGRPSVDP